MTNTIYDLASAAPKAANTPTLVSVAAERYTVHYRVFKLAKAALNAVVNAYNKGRATRALSRLSDRELADIGLSRGQISEALNNAYAAQPEKRGRAGTIDFASSAEFTKYDHGSVVAANCGGKDRQSVA
ncbi:DUF1127 domain-containing protein [Kiloniella sp. b19]|uniref:DUF1127 domain-containing protein n=1 Tax=Kiloniella sp. GXU_MW_B19 TaxID=3141326 RepID=UPI0031D8E00F